MKLQAKKGTTSKRIFIGILDSSSTTGAYKTGLTNSSVTAYYSREDDGNAGATAISLSAGTRGTWSSGGFVEKDSSNAKGIYELGIPNAALATGSNTVIITIQDAASNNVAPLQIEVQLVDYDPQDAVHLGLSALPNTACTTNASLITSGTGTDQLSVSGGRGKADTVYWNAAAVIAPNVSGIPLIDIKYVLGTIVTAATAGILDVNAKNINNVAATSVTTINPIIGLTGQVNFVGSGASALVKTDVEDFGGTAGTFASGIPAVQLANGVTHGGTTAMLELGSSTSTAAFYVHNSGGDAAKFVSTGGGGHGLELGGQGAGHGLETQGGASGYGIDAGGAVGINAAGTSGDGIYAISSTLNGIQCVGAGSNDGFQAQGGTTGRGIHAIGGATSGAGIRAEGQGSSSPGIHGVGGVTSGAGLRAEARGGNSNGSEFVHQGTGQDLLCTYVAANAIQTLLWTDTTAGDFTVANSIGKSLYTSGNAPGAASGLALVGSNMGTVTSVSGAVGSVTGNVGGDVQGKVLGGGASAIAGVGVSSNVTQWGGTNVGAVPPDTIFIRTGTAQAGSSTTITLDAGASATNNLYRFCIVQIRSGTGAGQSAVIANYVGSTKVATINGTWATNPDATSVFTILPLGSVEVLGGGDISIDTTTTPWDEVTTVVGTGLPSAMGGTGIELLRRRLFDTGSTGIGNTTTVLGQAIK